MLKANLDETPTKVQREEGDTGSDGGTLEERDLAQVLAYASNALTNGPNIELGVVGIIVDNRPNAPPLPTSNVK